MVHAFGTSVDVGIPQKRTCRGGLPFRGRIRTPSNTKQLFSVDIAKTRRILLGVKL